MSAPLHGRTAHARHEPRRIAVLVVVVAALVTLSVVSSSTATSNVPAPRVPAAEVATSAESTAAYCAGLEHERGVIESDVAVADVASGPRTVEVTTSNELGQVSHRLVRVAAGGVVYLDPANLIGGSFEGLSLVAEGGGIAASEALRSVNGTAVAPCLTEAAPSWWLTGGSTDKGQSVVLSIFNPYATFAVASVTLYTPQGQPPTPTLKGLVLAPHGLLDVSVRADAPDEAPFTAHVTATVGNVVVYGVTRALTTAHSISLLPGAPALAREAFFPLASSAKGLTASLVIGAPRESGAATTVSVWAPAGCTRYCPAPFAVGIAGGSTATLVLSPTPRVAAGDRLSSEVVASSGGFVAVERVAFKLGWGQYAPVDDPSLEQADHLALVDPYGSGFDAVGIVNPGSHAVRVTLEVVTSRGPQPFGPVIDVVAHSTVVLARSSLRAVLDGVLLLKSSGPISAAGQASGTLDGSGTLVGVPTT